MIAVVKSTEANFASKSSQQQPQQQQQRPARRTSWTVLLNLAPRLIRRRPRRRMSTDQAKPPSTIPTPKRSPSPSRSASPSPTAENRRFPGISLLPRSKKKTTRKQSKDDLLVEAAAGMIRIEQGKLKLWASCFDNLLSDPIGIQLFQGFLKGEVSEENIMFWKACQTFKSQRLTPVDTLQVKAQEIFSEYISMSPSAPNLVNIDHHTRESIMAAISKPTRDMFYKAEHSIYKLMCQDSFSRFVQSRPFKDGVFKDCLLPKLN